MARTVLTRDRLDLLTSAECKKYALSTTAHSLAKLMYDAQAVIDAHHELFKQEQDRLRTEGKEEKIALLRENYLSRLERVTKIHGDLVKQQAIMKKYLPDEDELTRAIGLFEVEGYKVIPSAVYELHRHVLDKDCENHWQALG
jgi:hypothetical protein